MNNTLQALDILSRMGAPAAVALVGLAAAIAVPLAIRRSLRSIERRDAMRLKHEIEVKRLGLPAPRVVEHDE